MDISAGKDIVCLTESAWFWTICIVLGQYHNLALTHSGEVYSWGWGIHGQLGHGCCDNEYYPKLVQFDSPVKQVAAGGCFSGLAGKNVLVFSPYLGHAHSIILTCDGKVFGFGSNVFGQLESNSRQMDSKKCTKPTWVVIMPDIYVPVEKIVTSYFHNVSLANDWNENGLECWLFRWP